MVVVVAVTMAMAMDENWAVFTTVMKTAMTIHRML